MLLTGLALSIAVFPKTALLLLTYQYGYTAMVGGMIVYYTVTSSL